MTIFLKSYFWKINLKHNKEEKNIWSAHGTRENIFDTLNIHSRENLSKLGLHGHFLNVKRNSYKKTQSKHHKGEIFLLTLGMGQIIANATDYNSWPK